MDLKLSDKTALVTGADRHNWQDSDTDKWQQMYEINELEAAYRAARK